MHPSILQQLAAEHVKDQLATADDMRARVRPAALGHDHPAKARGSACPGHRRDIYAV